MTEIHALLGRSALLLSAILAVVATATALAGRHPIANRLRPMTDLLVYLAFAVVVLAGFVGPILLATGATPSEPSHVAYAVLAVMLLPMSVGVALARRRTRADGRRYGWVALGALLLAAVALLLMQTG